MDRCSRTRVHMVWIFSSDRAAIIESCLEKSASVIARSRTSCASAPCRKCLLGWLSRYLHKILRYFLFYSI